MATIQTLGAIDTLVRSSNLSNWGLADDGINKWTQSFGSDVLTLSSYTLSAPDWNKGLIQSGGGVGAIQCGTGTAATLNMLKRVKMVYTSGSHIGIGFFFRLVDSNNYYLAQINSDGNLYLYKNVAGTFTPIASASSGWNGTYYFWLRIVASGTSFTLNYWQDGTVEPASPLISTTDSQFSAAGPFGIHTLSTSSGVVYIDSVVVTNNAGTTLALDSFARTVLNTASDTYNKWHQWRGSPSGLQVSSNTCLITGQANETYDLLCGFNLWTNGAVKMRGKLSNIGDTWGVRARWQSDSYYYAAIYSSNTVQIWLVNSGSVTVLASTSFTCAANTLMWLELDCIGNALNLYAWLDGNAKPVNPTCSATDATYAGGPQTVWSPYGNFGLLFTTVATRTGTFDQFTSTSTDASYASGDSPYGQSLSAANATTFTNNFAGINLPGGTSDIPLIASVGSNIYYRYQIIWAYMEPAQGVLVWDWADDVIARGNAAKVNAYWGLCGVPTWAQYNPTDYTANPLFNATQAAIFSALVAQRHNGANGHGTMLAFECGNEEYVAQATGGTYAALLAVAVYAAVKAVNSSMLVGSVSNTNATPFYGLISAWMDNWYANGGLGNVDFFTMHPYSDSLAVPFTTIESAGQSTQQLLQQMDAIMTAYQDPTPIWITEQGWPPSIFNGGSSNNLPMPETNIQLLIILNYLRVNSRRFTHYFWYSLGDWYNGAGANLQTPFYTWQSYVQQYPSWSWIAGSVYFGSFNLNNNAGGYYVTSRQLGNMQIQQALTPLARYEGDKKSGQYIGSRKIKMSIKVVGASRTDLEAKLDALYLALRVPQQRLNYHTGDGRYLIADAVFAPADTAIGQILAVTVPVDFTCQQPYSNAFLSSAFGVAPQLLSANPSAPNYILNFTVNVLNATQFSRPVIVVTNKRTVSTLILSSTNQFVIVGMTNGNVYSTLYVGSLSAPLYIGDTLILQSGINTQMLIVAANASIGAGSITVQPFTANFSYPTGSTMVLDIHWTTVALQQWLDNQYWDVLAGTHCAVNGDALVFTSDPVQGISVIDTASPSTQVEFLGTPITLNPGRNDVSLYINSPSVPLVSVAVFYTQRYQN